MHRAGDAVHVQPGAREALARLRASGRRLAIFTNGSHDSPAWFAAGLRAAGLDIADAEMLTPLRSVQAYLRMRRLDGRVLASKPSRRDGSWRRNIRSPPTNAVDAVFVAHADAVHFPLLERAARAIIAGARLLTASYAPAWGRGRPDPQPGRDDHRSARQGQQHPSCHRRQTLRAAMGRSRSRSAPAGVSSP